VTTPTSYLPQSLSPEVISVAIEHRLGEHVATYARAKNTKRIVAAFAVVAFTEPLVLLVFVPVIAVFVGAAIWLMMNSPVFSAKARARPFHAFANGYIEFAKSGPVAYRWDQMQTVHQEITTVYVNGINTGTKYIYKIAMTDGRQVRLHSDRTDMVTFGPLIQQSVAAVQVPQVVEALRAGQAVPFGDIEVTPAGVRTRKGDLPWAEVRNVRLVRGYFSVDRQGKKLAFYSKASKQVPNLHTMLIVLNEGMKKQGRF